MHKKVGFFLLLSCFLACSAMLNEKEVKVSFKEDQFRFPRVREAFEFHEMSIETKLLLKRIKKENLQIYIRAFKSEGTMEIWAKGKLNDSYQLFADYKFCDNSGRLGPKREQGDHQIPEGIYNISEFNPSSNFHLSLKVSYPNKADSILGVKGNYGGMIFLHGGCSTVGCIPITDLYISELYVLSVMAKEAGQVNIPVHIFPARLNIPNIRTLQSSDYSAASKRLWRELEPGYKYFENTGKVPQFTINSDGQYVYQKK